MNSNGRISGAATIALAVAAAALAFALQHVSRPAAACTPGPWYTAAPAPPPPGARGR